MIQANLDSKETARRRVGVSVPTEDTAHRTVAHANDADGGQCPPYKLGKERWWAVPTLQVLVLSVVWIGMGRETAGQTAVPSSKRALIEQALGEPTKISLDKVKLGDAVARITEQTGVEIVMSPESMRYVPDGAGAVIQRVNIANVPLRQGLSELFSPLGMTFELRDDRVEIVPKEVIRCLGRAATWAELRTLEDLAKMQPGLDAKALAALQARIQFQVSTQGGAWDVLSQTIRNVGAGAGDQVLSVACANLGWGWCLSEDHIVIGPLQQEIRRRLQTPITLRMSGRPVFEVMTAVGQAVHVPVRTEPGAITSLPSSMQNNFSVSAKDQPAEQVLAAIAANTGLGYLIDPDGVTFYNPNMQAPKSAPSGGTAVKPGAGSGSGGSDPYVGKIVVPLSNGTSMEWLVRWSELPEDLRERRADDLERSFNQLREKSAATAP